MTVTSPKGFRAAGVTAGLKASGRPDLALVVNDGPLRVAAGVFTTNRVVAAPVVWSRQAVADGVAHAVVLNSGGANACTGPEGFGDTHRTAEHVAQALDTSPGDVLVCSTGLIGERLPMDLLLPGVDAAAEALSTQGGEAAATAIMTTDTVAKTVHVAGDGWSVGGIAKGAGMLAPGLATMLVVLTTDAAIAAPAADDALRAATRTTFDRVDSDGCMSTNDTVLLLASGASGVVPEPAAFLDALTQACAELARALVADAEGASHDIAVTVINATTEDAAVAVARAVTRSNLFKAAVYGNDPNWGRVLAAAGTVPADVAPFDADRLDVSINGVQVCRAGGVGEDRSLVDLAAAREVQVLLDLHAGGASATVWTNDLTHDYVHENSAYST
ncbi:bifunctional glutamate N-acetyltransferase/amino-acid acetyltransferase ArgJ [Cellulomonas chengniuliangii]|uniref:Arginine biosynthesis bifunctional protein ArgJ n=1 Tax=Cellulomonas chengniuliangii TaxID=2968084 RepID=A0ABY5KX99_9CELL|nr:bifunctional glutamate N-acetyltransferase/amino-acid acetyltransferase ArgJ [Cellulomonas chengniuliangii]MCC2310184.1 bifunctional glutamate N-acetyltransferase/amino-acid acetyltransferase ArgJ [Cellulomonas chengniuliangii]MCC2319109.1 bifunctional glutamate N-acetyltransferase/amino-acid acetyltransferase ArgJ [Cellulomonas chengniuliangii]UUI74081.1 bifunctional glutamate N-acetyltransferase/amino-acid acetyltransferase ArgJ [Cellulomonas chengniuliangii]